MEDKIYTYPDDFEIIDQSAYTSDVTKCFSTIPSVAHPLMKKVKFAFHRIEQALYSAPSLINTLRAIIPEETLKVLLTDEQKTKLAAGTLKLMTKKDGSLMATLVNPKTNKIVSNVSLERIKVTPELTQAIANYSTQMQLAQIAEQIQSVQIAIEEVRQGQEYDRLATAYSCQQKFLQALAIGNPELRESAILRLIGDAEDSRNLLMQSQKASITFLKEQPESTIGKFLNGATPEKIDTRMSELRENLSVLNMVSLIEALAYEELDESEAARISLQYYADYINKVYLDVPDFVKRLDSMDSSPKNYWSKTLPQIKKKIKSLPCNTNIGVIEEEISE